jgi:hypothetical protein
VKYLRFIFAYAALVVSNGAALLTVQKSLILLKRNHEYFSEADAGQAQNSTTPTNFGDVKLKHAISPPSARIRRPEEVSVMTSFSSRTSR